MSFYHIKTGPASLDLSVVVPVYNEEPNVETLGAEIEDAMSRTPWTWECIWVDDGSSDGTAEKLRRLQASNPRHRPVRLTVHEGQSAALAVGISASLGKFVATLDGDGQSDPADIPRLVSLLVQGDLHIVNGRREKRRDHIVRKLSSRIANGFRNRLTGERVTDVGCSLRAFRRETVDGIFVFKGMHRFLPTLIKMNGFARSTEIPVGHRPRRHGQTKYGISNRLWVGIADTMAVRWMRGRMACPRIGDASVDASSRANGPHAGPSSRDRPGQPARVE